MSQELPHSEETAKKEYHSPNLTDYGKMSELTQTIMGDTGDDGGAVPSSYSAST